MKHKLMLVLGVVALFVMMSSVAVVSARVGFSNVRLDLVNPDGGQVLTLSQGETATIGVNIVNRGSLTSGKIILICEGRRASESVFKFDSFAPTGPIVTTQFTSAVRPFVQVWDANTKPRAFEPGATFNGSLVISANANRERGASTLSCVLLEELRGFFRTVERETLVVQLG